MVVELEEGQVEFESVARSGVRAMAGADKKPTWYSRRGGVVIKRLIVARAAREDQRAVRSRSYCACERGSEGSDGKAGGGSGKDSTDVGS